MLWRPGNGDADGVGEGWGGGGGEGGGDADDGAVVGIAIGPLPAVELKCMRIGHIDVFYQHMPTGHIWHMSSPSKPIGRLTGPFGKDVSGPHQLSWSMSCSQCTGLVCRIVKSNKQLNFESELLIKWLLARTISSLGLIGSKHKAAFGKAPLDKL